jgi:L-ascorbate metabolism protein UlaG (beta-lactamase superfamily)
MRRLIASVMVVSALAMSSLAAAPAKVTVRWHGQSFFEVISSKGTRIVFDPHAIEAYGRIAVRADLILVSHLHNDHSQIDVVENRNQAKVIWGLKANGRKLDWNPIDEQFRDVHVRGVGVYHDNSEGIQRGKNTVFVVDVDGMHFVHLGDLGHLLTEKQLKQIGPVDVLFIPVGGVFTINGSEAKQVVAQLKPRKYIIPMHCGTKDYDELLPVDEFLEEQKAENIKKSDTSNQLIVSADYQPAEPTTVVLNWK